MKIFNMKKGVQFCLFFLLPLLCFSQESAVKFMKGLTWKQIKQKAKKENKLIFIDCYATWCGPCKQMDRVVYPFKEIGNQMNQSFISVKAQVDTSKNDDVYIQQWYATVKWITKKYKVVSMPTYLFFSSDGSLVHKATGFKGINDFIALIKDAQDSSKQVYTLLNKFYNNKLTYTQLPLLTQKVLGLLQDKETAYKIARVYFKQYLNKINNEQLLAKNNLEFIAKYPIFLKSTDNYFRLFIEESINVDRAIQQNGFAQKVVNIIITKENIFNEIKPKDVWRQDEPNWQRIEQIIKHKYGYGYARENIINAKIRWYTHKNFLDSVIKYEVAKIDIYGLDTSFMGCLSVNNMIYNLIFKHSSDTFLLNKAIRWMELIIRKDSTISSRIDTYANLLYKVGRISDAIYWQQKAVNISPRDVELYKSLTKMKRNEPTWIDN